MSQPGLLQQSPVLTSFASTRNASVQETEWNLLATPLICGSLAIMDNMITDNLQLMEAVGKDHVKRVLQQYSSAGLFKLYHRKKGRNIRKITSLNEVFLDWLTTDNDNLNRVEFSILDSDQNKELRKKIKYFNNHHYPPEKRLKIFFNFMSEEISGYGSFLKDLNAIFDEAPGSSSSYELYPRQIQYRILSCIGFSDQPEALIAQTAGQGAKVLKETLLKRLSHIEHKLFTRNQLTEILETDAFDAFFEKLNMECDPTLTGLLRSLENVNSPLWPVWRKLVLEVYTSGIPEANGGRVLLENETLSRGPDIDFEKLSQLIQAIEKDKHTLLAQVDLWQDGKLRTDLLTGLREELFDTSVPLLNENVQARINTFAKDIVSPVSTLVNYSLQLPLPESCTIIQHTVQTAKETLDRFHMDITYKIKLSEGKLYGTLPGDFTTRANLLIDRIGLKTFDASAGQ
ncbi:MAG: hypothetical protein Roseis2KO_41460 [Roseivirga sp.]